MSSFFAPANITTINVANQDLLVGNANGSLSRLAVGGNGSFLNVSGGVIRWGNTIDSGGLTISAGGITVTGNTSLGTLVANLIFTDNTYDIGASGATRPRSLYLGTALIAGTNPATNAGYNIRLPNNSAIGYRNGTNTGDVDALTVDVNNQVVLGGGVNVNATQAGIYPPTVIFPNVGTSAVAANVVFSGGTNSILLHASSLRYKNVIGELTVEAARKIVMGLRPIVFFSKSKADDPRQEFVGLGAEHVADVDDRFITRDEQGRPSWVQYPALVAPLARMVQDIDRRLAAIGA